MSWYWSPSPGKPRDDIFFSDEEIVDYLVAWATGQPWLDRGFIPTFESVEAVRPGVLQITFDSRFPGRKLYYWMKKEN